MTDKPRDPSQYDLLALDIDMRLSALWHEAYKVEEWDLEGVGAFMRACYGQGYVDALKDRPRGKLCIDNGYTIPKFED